MPTLPEDFKTINSVVHEFVLDDSFTKLSLSPLKPNQGVLFPALMASQSVVLFDTMIERESSDVALATSRPTAGAVVPIPTLPTLVITKLEVGPEPACSRAIGLAVPKPMLPVAVAKLAP